MFSKLKSALGFGEKSGSNASDTSASSTVLGASKLSQWANGQGLSFSNRESGRGYQMDGKIGGKSWRMESGRPSRDFIQGEELRARAELGVRDDVAVMIMTRQLKNDLDKRAFALYTDTLQTVADLSLPEEMRWLAIYQEMVWEGLGRSFVSNYIILADTRENAMAWVSKDIVEGLMNWPTMDPTVPKILMLLRGKAYLRMQYTQDDQPTLEHAASVFTAACEQALSNLSADLTH